MGRPKGSKKLQCKRTIEEKMIIIRKHLDEHVSLGELEKEYRINRGLIHAWIQKYLEKGEMGLSRGKNQKNPLVTLLHKKELTTEESLLLENLQLRIENERLKKGYQAKGAGHQKEFISLNKVNAKSSKR